jgi:hypothetical protein
MYDNNLFVPDSSSNEDLPLSSDIKTPTYRSRNIRSHLSSSGEDLPLNNSKQQISRNIRADLSSSDEDLPLNNSKQQISRNIRADLSSSDEDLPLNNSKQQISRNIRADLSSSDEDFSSHMKTPPAYKSRNIGTHLSSSDDSKPRISHNIGLNLSSEDKIILPNNKTLSSSDDDNVLLPYVKQTLPSIRRLSSSSDDELEDSNKRTNFSYLQKKKIPPLIRKLRPQVSSSEDEHLPGTMRKFSSNRSLTPLRIRLPDKESSEEEAKIPHKMNPILLRRKRRAQLRREAELQIVPGETNEERRERITKTIRSEDTPEYTERRKLISQKVHQRNIDRVYNLGKRKIDLIKQTLQLEKFPSRLIDEEKKMVPTNIPKDILGNIFSMAGSKARMNFSSASSVTRRAGRERDIDMSDAPLTLIQLGETHLLERGINITGLHLLLTEKDKILTLSSEISKHLTKLILSYSEERINSVARRRLLMMDIKIVAVMPKLTTFRAMGRVTLNNLSFVEHSPHLDFFELNRVKTHLGLTPLVQCKQLRVLHLIECLPVSFTPIAQLTSLRELICTCAGLFQRDIITNNFLTNLYKLKLLYLSNFNLPDLSVITPCTRLETLVLKNCPLTNLNGLVKFHLLQSLHISECSQLNSVLELQQCPQLKALVLDDLESLTDIEGIGACTLLEEFTISDIDNMDELFMCKQLRYLEIHGTFLENKTNKIVDFLKNFPSLTYLVVGSLNMKLDLSLFINLLSLKRIWYTLGKVKNARVLEEEGITVKRKRFA